MKKALLVTLALVLALCALALAGCGSGGGGAQPAATPTASAGLALAAYSPNPIAVLQPVGDGSAATAQPDPEGTAGTQPTATPALGGAAAVQGSFDHANSYYYPSIDTYRQSPSLLMLKDFKTYQQTSEYSCAAACAVMAFNHFGITHVSEQLLTLEMDLRSPENPREDGSYGGSTPALAAAFTSRGYKVTSSEDTADADGISFDTDAKLSAYLLDALNRNQVVLLENVEWGGHWRVLAGYDTMATETLADDVLIFGDPYDTTDHAQDGYCVQSFQRFYYTWFDYNMLPADARIQQYVTVSQ